MAGDDFPAPSEGFVLTQFLVAASPARSPRLLCRRARRPAGAGRRADDRQAGRRLGDQQRRWGPTDDKPEVVLEPPSDPNRASAVLNLRVADIQAAYRDWSAKGAVFLTRPRTTAGSCAAPCATPTAT
jgi:hypothetical protein